MRSKKRLKLHRILIAGFGGQGVLALGDTIAYAAMREGRHITWIPSYGPESRGGTSNCHVTISDGEISSPVVDEPDVLIAMNLPSMDRFEPAVKEGGLIIYNSSLTNRKPHRSDVRSVAIPATDVANELGNINVANMVALGAYLKFTGVVSRDTAVNEAIPYILAGKKKELIDLDVKAVDEGVKIAGRAA